MRTFGVEEELLIVNPDTGEPLALADAMLSRRSVKAGNGPSREPDIADGHEVDDASSQLGLSAELKLEQIETQTPPCLSYADLLQQIRAGRAMADDAARRHQAKVAALATSPLALTTHTTPDPRYSRMLERFGLTVQEQLTCGFHVHTFVESPEEGVAVLDRIRDKLAVLIALSANSPFWNGASTGFESFRTQAWNRWPSSGPAAIHGSPAAYRRLVTRLLETGVVMDEGMIYFEARLSRNHPTVEVRVADVCLRAVDAALIAVLVRALVETAAREWRTGVEPLPVPTVLLKMASWQASNLGLTGDLLDFGTFRPSPAATVVNALVEYVAPVLEEQGELELVHRGIRELLHRGTGSSEQRAARERILAKDSPADGGLGAVVCEAVSLTMLQAQPQAEAGQAVPGLLRADLAADQGTAGGYSWMPG